MKERYGQFCPVAKALDMVGSRWTLLVLRELLAGGRYFSDLHRGVPLMSRTLLAQRLRDLERDGMLIATQKDRGRGYEYRLTAAGVAMEPVLAALGDWGVRYAQARITPEDCDPAMLFWGIRRHGDLTAFPTQRFVIRFEFRNLPPNRKSMTTWWLVWDGNTLDHCLDHPGFMVDLVVNSLIDTLAKVWMGSIGLTDATASGAIRIEGSLAARDVFVRLLDLRQEPCLKEFRYVFA